ncbi:MAG: archease [candidate division KSB1 bacterium]|jgi:SHS2 domain-containing protein|nr:archease [candidate division KSB1 bacterium]
MSGTSSPLRYKQIEHTGDIGIQIFGKTLHDLFINAAFGMFEIITDLGDIEKDTSEIIEVAGDGVEELLVNWLSELNYLFVTENKVFNRFVITRYKDFELTATVRGATIDPSRHPVNTEIKAVTYHELYVKELKNRWEAQVIFDI